MNRTGQGRGEQETVADLCLLVASLYQEDKSKVTGELMATLTSRLMAAESQPGGPYFGPKNTPDFFTNLAVGYLFALLGKPLPNIVKFIEINRHSPVHSPQVSTLLKKYDVLLAASPSPPKNSPIHTGIYATAQKQLGRLPQPEKASSLLFLNTVHRADANHEIALLPTFFADSLISPAASLPTHQLGLANIYCWIAYSIYDQLLDDTPDPKLLPIANIAMRKSLKTYQDLFPQVHAFHSILEDTFAAMDHANAWEQSHARFQREGKNVIISELPQYGRYEILADRCSGHILGPLAIAILCDVSSEALHHIEKGLRHYLIARQLSDDIHDWKEDLAAGHASSVVTYILRELQVSPDTVAFAPLLKNMRSRFWDTSIESFTKIIVRHLKRSRYHLLQTGLLKIDGPIFTLHNQLEQCAEQSLLEYRSSRAFLAAYTTASDSHQSRRLPRQ